MQYCTETWRRATLHGRRTRACGVCAAPEHRAALPARRRWLLKAGGWRDRRVFWRERWRTHGMYMCAVYGPKNRSRIGSVSKNPRGETAPARPPAPRPPREVSRGETRGGEAALERPRAQPNGGLGAHISIARYVGAFVPFKGHLDAGTWDGNWKGSRRGRRGSALGRLAAGYPAQPRGPRKRQAQ